MYEQLDILLSYKRRYKQLKFVHVIDFLDRRDFSRSSSLIVHGYDEQPNYRQSLLKQIFDLFKRSGTTSSSSTRSTASSTTVQQDQFMNDIEHVPFDGLTDFFKSAARG